MKVLIIGSGMYVTGREGTGTGTILSSLAQISKAVAVEEVVVVSKRISSSKTVADAAERINGLLKSSLNVSFKSLGEDSQQVIAALQAEKKFDACIISVPDHLHFSVGKICLGLSIPTLMVKPLTPTLAEANELVRLAEKNKTFACVEFHKRYDETNLWIKKSIEENKIGKLNYVTVDYSQRIDIPMKTFKGWSSESNIFQYLGVHYVDLIYFLTGFRPARLVAYGTDGILKNQGVDTYDSVHALIEWQNPNDASEKFISSLNTNWIDPNCSSALSDQKYKVIGTKGRIECDQKNRGIELVTDATGIQQINPYFSDYLPDENGNLKFGGYGFTSIATFIHDVMKLKQGKISLAELNKHRPSFMESLTSVAVVEAANESMKNNSEWIEVGKGDD
ncbi:MAG: Gfo/Idh/MocA family oxidoreductase [Bacteroidetes bacterium]|nr:Gfo/Idh/MocA family oxidoreductase [Bacteroidota bacterium]